MNKFIKKFLSYITLNIVQTFLPFARNIFVLTPSMMYDRRGFMEDRLITS